jgi:hypothetical protein
VVRATKLPLFINCGPSDLATAVLGASTSGLSIVHSPRSGARPSRTRRRAFSNARGSKSPRLYVRELTLLIFDLIAMKFESVIKTFDSIAMIFDLITMNFESVIKTFNSIAMIFDSIAMTFDSIAMIFESIAVTFDLIAMTFRVHRHDF